VLDFLARTLGEFTHGSRCGNHVATFIQNDAHLRQQFIALNTGTNLITECVQYTGCIGGEIESCHAERIERELLVIVQRFAALPINCPQGRNLRRRAAYLGTQVLEHGDRYALQLVERPTTHLQEADLQRRAEAQIHAIARQDRLYLATVQREKLADRERAQGGRQLRAPEKLTVPMAHCRRSLSEGR
jgi:hypothetical protein